MSPVTCVLLRYVIYEPCYLCPFTVCDLRALLPDLCPSYGKGSTSPVTCVLLTVCDLRALLPDLCPSYGKGSMNPVTCVLLTVCDI